MFNIRHLSEDLHLGIMDLKTFSENREDKGRRETERAGVIYLLTNLLDTEEVGLYYDVHNKPHLDKVKGYISISHSHDKLAILYNKKENTGVDIELLRDKVLGIQHKFLNDAERKAADNNIEKLITYWASKETLYKIYGKKGVDFKKHLFVEAIHNDEIKGHIRVQGYSAIYALRKEKIDDYILVFAQHEIH